MISNTSVALLTWTSGITRLDHIRNDDIYHRYGVALIMVFDLWMDILDGDLKAS